MENIEAEKLNKDHPMPLYFQLKESLRRYIVAEKWIPGRKIPSEMELCEMYNVSRITARKALADLQSEGYLEKRQGKGTFVKRTAMEQKLGKFYSFSEELKKSGIRETARMAGFELQESDEEVAAGLQIHPGDRVFKISRIRLADDTPYAYEISYIPYSLAASLTERMVSDGGLYCTLTSLGIGVDSAVEKLRAVNMDGQTAELLDAHEGDAAIYLIRTARCGPETVEYCTSTVVGDFFSYTVELK